MAALLLLEAASRPPPALLLLEVVRAPPHTEHPPRRENLLLPARAAVTLAFPSWTPPSSPPLPMRTAALPLRLAWHPPPAPRSLLTRALAPAQALVASWTLIRASRSSLPPPLSLLRRTVPAFRRPSLHRHLLAAPGIRGRPPAQQRVWVARLCHHLRAANAMPPRLLLTVQPGDEDGAVAAGVGGAAPSPQAPMPRIPKKHRKGGGAPSAARGGQSAQRDRPPSSSASVLGSAAGLMSEHRLATERNAQLARGAATAAREDAEKLRAAQDLLVGPPDGSPPLPSAAPVLPQPLPAAPPQPAAGAAPPGVEGGEGTATAPTPGAAAPSGDAFVGGRMGAVLHNPPILDAWMLEQWSALTAAQDAGGQHDPVTKVTPVIAYFEPQLLPYHTIPGSAPRESAFGAIEPCLLRLRDTGIDGAQSGPHLVLYSLRHPDIALFTFHTSCIGPMLPFHAYDFSERNKMRPTPDTAYVMVHGNHLRRGLTIRFPTGMGEKLMPLCNDFLASPTPPRDFRKPPTLALLALNTTPLGFAFYARSSNRLPKGGGYLEDPSTHSAGQRVIVTLSRPSAGSSSTGLVSVRPDNTSTSEECFPLSDATFSVVRSATGAGLPLRKGGGRTPGARASSRGRTPPLMAPSKEMVQIEVGCATSSRRILLDLFPSQDTRQSLTPIGVVTACRQLLLSAQGSEVMAPPAPTPPPGQEAGASAAAQNAATAAGAGATPADVVRARSVLAMVAQPPPPALDPAAASQKVAISRLKAVSTRRDKPHVVILADSAVPEDWGEMVQRQASELCITAISVLDDSLSLLAGAYLSARETHPMPVQELVLVVPISILRAISRMPIQSRLEVAVRDTALRKLSTELLSTVHLLTSQPLVPGTGGSEAAPTPRCVSIYIWRANAKQSDLGAASVAVYTQLKKEFPDGGLVRVCTQFDNVPLNQAQQAVAVDWDSRLRTMYLRTTEGAEEWTDAALAFFTTVVGGSAVHNWRTALRADADASVMTVVGAAVPTISVNLENLRRAVHNTNLCKPPRERWNADFVAPESATLFSAVTERTWAWTSTSAGVFREKTMVRSSTDFDQLATALSRTPSSSERRTTGSQPPAAVDFGLDAYAAVRAVTTGYLQTVRNLAPGSLSESKHVFHAMLDYATVPRRSDGLGIQGRLAKVINLDLAALILLRRARSCAKEMARHPAALRAVWRIFAPPEIARDFNFADDFTCAIMANDIDDEHEVHTQHEKALDAQQAIHARRVADVVTGRINVLCESFLHLSTQRTGPFDPPPPPGGAAAAAGAATATAAQAAPANAAAAAPPRALSSAERRAKMRLKLAAREVSPELPRIPPPEAAAAAAVAPSVPEAQGQSSTGTLSDVLFLAHSIGCPLAVLTVDPNARQAVASVKVYPNGVVPYDSTRSPAPGAMDEYVPMSTGDPDHDPQHRASETSSLAWLTRFVEKRPGFIIIATRQTVAGRIVFASITRVSRPDPVQPYDPFLPPATAGAAGGANEGGASRASEHAPGQAAQGAAAATAARVLALVPPPPQPAPPDGHPMRPPDARVGADAGGSSGTPQAGLRSGRDQASPQDPPPHAPIGGIAASTEAAGTGTPPTTVTGGGGDGPGDIDMENGGNSATPPASPGGITAPTTTAGAGTSPIAVSGGGGDTPDDAIAASTATAGAGVSPIIASGDDGDGPGDVDMESGGDSGTPPAPPGGTAAPTATAGAGTSPIAVSGGGDDTSDDVDMGSDGNSETPPAPPDGAGPEDEAAPPSASARSEAPFPVDHDKGPAAPERAVEGATPADAAARNDGADDIEMENASLETDAAETGDGSAAAGDEPPPEPHPNIGLDHAFKKAGQLGRLNTMADHAADEIMRRVYGITASMVQPGGPMAHLLIDTSVGCSAVLPQAIAALDGVAGLMAEVRAVDAVELLPFFVKAAVLDVMDGNTATGGTSPNAPSTH